MMGEVPYASAAIRAKKKPTTMRGLNVGLSSLLASSLRGLLSNEGTGDHQDGARDLEERAGLAKNDDGQDERDNGVELDHGCGQVHSRRLARSEVAVSAQDEMQDARR